MGEKDRSTRVTITVAARRTGVEVSIVRRCVQLGLIEETLTEEDLAELRRVRRLSELGINMPGVEVILQMRRRIEALQAEMEQLQRRLGFTPLPRAPEEWTWSLMHSQRREDAEIDRETRKSEE